MAGRAGWAPGSRWSARSEVRTYDVDAGADRRRLGAEAVDSVVVTHARHGPHRVPSASERAAGPSCRAIYSWPAATWCGLGHGLDGRNQLPGCAAPRDRGAGVDGVSRVRVQSAAGMLTPP